jgi:Na+-translocating ferredoxin:NAD+ oxidoreductase RnfE subunit
MQRYRTPSDLRCTNTQFIRKFRIRILYLIRRQWLESVALILNTYTRSVYKELKFYIELPQF